MLVAIAQQNDLQLRREAMYHTNATYISIIGALSGSDEAGWDAMQAFLHDLRTGPEERAAEIAYELDPNARPEPAFVEMMAGADMGMERVKFEEATGPFVERLRQVVAENG